MKLDNQLKEEAKMIGIGIAALAIILQIAFYKGSIFTNIKLTLAIAYAVIIPGYLITYMYKERWDFLERTLGGILLLIAFHIVVSYNLGIFGISIQTYTYIIPAILIILGIWLGNKTKGDSK